MTSLYGGTRVSKADLRMEAIGTIDELNAHLGLLRDQPVNIGRQDIFQVIQEHLFVIGAQLANDKEKENIPALPKNSVSWLEQGIDGMDEVLPPMKYFILPGGHTSVSMAHVARCVCRRAERHVVRLADYASFPHVIQIYLNRLSDYLFVLARLLSQELKVNEIPWRPKQ